MLLDIFTMWLEKSNDGVSTAGGRARYIDSLVIVREKKSVGRIGNQERDTYLSQCLIERERKSTRPVILRKRHFGRFNDGFAQEKKPDRMIVTITLSIPAIVGTVISARDALIDARFCASDAIDW